MATPMDEDDLLDVSAAAADGEQTLATSTSAADDVAKNPISVADPDSDTDSDEDDEEAIESQIQTLEYQLGEQPTNYDLHVQYILCLRKSGQIEKLRAARKEMSRRFPLTAQMWQEWAKDEISLSSGIVESFSEIEQLYERGVQDYLSVQLWCDYLNFVQENDESVSKCLPSGIAKMRDLFERALTAAGLHITEGGKIWEAYREFEQAISLTISDEDDEEKQKQNQRIRALFHRQLSVPLDDLRSTLIEYKAWESEQGNTNDLNSDLDGVPSNVSSAYQKAIAKYNERKQYEEQLIKPDASQVDKFQPILNYLKFEESCGDPARIQVLYERAISEFPVSDNLWMGYTSFLDRTLKVPAILKSVYYRATRNCPWVADLWVRYLLSLERVHASEEELGSVFEQSLQSGFLSIKECLDIYLTRVDGLRRRISSTGVEDNGLDFQLIRQTFVDAAGFLSLEVGIEDLLHLHAYWARLEASLGKDMVAARGVWENLLKKSGSILDVWQHYIRMEVEMGHIHEARSIYKRCYNKRFTGSGSEDICNSWLRFEREFGTIDDYDVAVKKVTPRLKELLMFKAQQESRVDVTAKDTHAVTTSQKRKPTQQSNKREPPAKKRKDATPKIATSSDHVPKEKTGYIVVDDEKVTGDTVDLEKPEVPSRRKVNDSCPAKQSTGNSKLKEPKANFYNDECTAFVSNLSLEANDEHLRNFFSDCGGVTAIRLLREKYTGKSRGLAYVDFLDNEHLEAAIRKNKMDLLGKRISIARSDPKSKKKSQAVGNSSSGRDKVQSRGDEGGKAQEIGGTGKERPSNDVSLSSKKNTFAAPRAVVRPLGWGKADSKMHLVAEEPKSNQEFRNLLFKK